jgi:hypothetical protein
VSDDGTIMLVCASQPWDRFGYGERPYMPFYHPQSGLTLMRCSVDAAEEYCLHGGCYVAPPAYLLREGSKNTMNTMMTAIVGAGMALISSVPAFALCPGGTDNPPLCVTGVVSFHSAGVNCYKVVVDGISYAINYVPPQPQPTEGWLAGLTSALADGSSRSVISDGTPIATCGDGTFLNITGVRNALY